MSPRRSTVSCPVPECEGQHTCTISGRYHPATFSNEAEWPEVEWDSSDCGHGEDVWKDDELWERATEQAADDAQARYEDEGDRRYDEMRDRQWD